MRKSALRRPTRENRSLLRPASTSRPSADLAGRRVALSPGIPAEFDPPLAAHHKIIGRWAAVHAPSNAEFTRPMVRRHIEATFNAAVMESLSRVELVNFRAAVLLGDDALPPAIALVCDDVGQIDLGWIEKTNVLSNTLFETVAPVGWRAAAYKALVEALIGPLPIFGFGDLMEELSAYYWDGETDDERAREALINYHGSSPEDLADMTMPSDVLARRPDFMLAENAAPMKDMPPALCQKLRALRDAHKALSEVKHRTEGNAWHFNFGEIVEYLPDFEERAHLPPLTLVPFEHFQREIDDVANIGMQMGFMDVAGLCQLSDEAAVDAWFASFKVGIDVLLAAQDLIDLFPAEPKDAQ